MASVLQGGGHSHPLARTVHACCRSRAVQAFQCPGAMSNSCNEMNIKESHGSDQACGFPVAPHLPLEQPGSGDAGGMNGYTRSLATALAETGVEEDVFTSATDSRRPAVEHPSPGVRVHNVAAGPLRKVLKEELPVHRHSAAPPVRPTVSFP